MTKKLFSAPFVAFILCGTLVPMGVIAWYGLTDRSGAFTLGNVAAMFGGDHARALGLSLALSLISTVICLVLAFPLGLILISSSSKTTLPVGIYRVVNDMYYASHTMACAGLTIAAAPVIAVYLIFQRQFIDGMTAGAVKG